MSRDAGGQDRLQVLYLGRSADVGALRRSLEAHGVITRARLTPEVAAVVTDAGVAADHPTVRAAWSLGVPVLDPEQAIDQLVGWRMESGTGTAAARTGGGPIIAGTIAILVVVLAALSILSSLLAPDEPAGPVQVNDSFPTRVIGPGQVDPR